MRFEFIKQHAKQFSIKKMANLMNVSRSGYYAYLNRPPSKRKKENERFCTEIRELYEEHRGLYGSPRIHAKLRERGLNCSRKRVARLMSKSSLRAKMNKSFRRYKKGQSQAAPNLLERNFKAKAINQIWASDISYIKTAEGWLYLAVVLDLCSRKVVGMAMADSMKTELVEKALASAFFRRKPGKGLIHHSDRGSQYTSDRFKKVCEQYSITLSMGSGSCYDNAAVESFFHTVKTELVYLQQFKNRQEARSALFEYIEGFYNRQRLHSTLGYLSPEAYEAHHKEQQILCS
jgi:transposase InsO family protein